MVLFRFVRKILLLLLFLLPAAILRGDPVYVVNVWVRNDGTNVWYSLGSGRATLRDVQIISKQAAEVSNTQTVHLITDNKTPISDLLRVCTAISHSGLSNVVITVCNSPHAVDNTSSVMDLSGAHIRFNYVEDPSMLDMKRAMKKPGANVSTNKTDAGSVPPDPLTWPMDSTR